MRKWLFGILIIGMLLLGCTLSISDFGVLSKFDMSATALIQTSTEVINHQLTTTQSAFGLATPDLQPTPDAFQLTATKLIADATQTAVAYENAACTKILRPVWDINEVIEDWEAQSIEVYARTYDVNVWVCDGALTQTRPAGDYSIILVTFEENITVDVAAYLVERALELISEYPPDETMLPPITISLFTVPNVPDFNPATDFVLHVTFIYEDAIAAYEGGLRGVELLDALGIEVPE